MIDCEKYLPDILDLAAGRAQPSEGLRSHLGKCSDCQQLFREAGHVHCAVAALAADEPSRLVTELILAEARTCLESNRFGFHPSRRWLAIGAAAAGILIVAIVCVLTSRTQGDLDPAAVAALESELDQTLGRVRSSVEAARSSPDEWFGRNPVTEYREDYSLSARLERLEDRMKRIRVRAQSGPFPLDFAPASEDQENQREGRSRFNPLDRRFVS